MYIGSTDKRYWPNHNYVLNNLATEILNTEFFGPPPPPASSFGYVVISEVWRSVNAVYVCVSEAWETATKVYTVVDEVWESA